MMSLYSNTSITKTDLLGIFQQKKSSSIQKQHFKVGKWLGNGLATQAYGPMFGSQRAQCGSVSQCWGDRDTGSEIKLTRKIQTLEFPSHKPMIQFKAYGEKKETSQIYSGCFPFK